MNGTPVLSDDSRKITKTTANVDVAARRFSSEQNTPGVYAAYWQARSGFFNLAPKLAEARSDLVKSDHQ
jgi:hypothetical protein